MDDLALRFSDLTTPDRADRARQAWDLYQAAHGGKLQDLIADLMHLADVDEHPGGGKYAARHAVINYASELPTWPAGTKEYTGSYLAQTRPAGQGWITVGDGDDVLAVAEDLVHGMHRVGFRMADMSEHVKDLAAGLILTSEQDHEFRVIANPATSG